MDPNDWTLTGNAGTDPTTNFLGTTDNELLVINPVGNVNIGTFDSAIPYPKLTVTGPDASGDIETTEVLRVMRHGVPGFVNQNSAGFFVGAFESGTDGRSQLDITVAGTPGPSNTFGSVPDVTVMSLLGNGNVGIGTTTPGGKLEIVGDIGNDGVRVRATNGTGVFASSFSPDGFGGIGLHAVGAVPAAIVAEGGDFSGIQAVGAGGITPTQPSTVVGAVVAYGSPGIFVQNNPPAGHSLPTPLAGGHASPDETPRIGQPALFVASGS